MTIPHRVVVSCKAIILHNDKVLIIKQFHKGQSYWDLPGGKMEYGEKPEETVVREVKEETGLDVAVGRLLGVWQFYSIVNDYQVVCITFQCTALTTDINLAHNPADEEITEHAYATKEDLLAWRYPFLDESVKGVFERI